MARIIDFPLPMSASMDAFVRDEGVVANDLLVQESLDLLAFYTAIGDKKVRMAVKGLVEQIAASAQESQRR